MSKTGQQLSLRCVTHRNSYYQLLSLAKENSQNRLLCVECLLPEEESNVKKEYVNLIPLSIAVNSPESLLDWIKKDQNSAYLKKFMQFSVKDLEKDFNEEIIKLDAIIKIIEQFKEQVRLQLEEYKSIQVQFKKLREQFFENINYNKFCKQLFQLQDLDKQFQSDQYRTLANELTKTIDEMLNNNLISKEIEQVYSDHRKTLINLQKPNQDQYLKQITQLFQQYEQYIKKLNEDVQCPSFSLLTDDYFKFLEQKIERESKKQIKQKNLIYKSSRDGLTTDTFWSKVNGKKNLILIFKSKSNSVFGGYSPCQWQSGIGYVQDDTLTSFLFSQSQSQIYPLKLDRRGQAIYCNKGYGPIFGGGHDIFINQDFSSGYSNLGHTYQWDQFQSQYSEILFGGAQPNIGECEIYELLLV